MEQHVENKPSYELLETQNELLQQELVKSNEISNALANSLRLMEKELRAETDKANTYLYQCKQLEAKLATYDKKEK